MAQSVDTEEQPDSPVPPVLDLSGEHSVENAAGNPADAMENPADAIPVETDAPAVVEFHSPPAHQPPILTIISGLPAGAYPLQPGETIVGRSSDADLQLKHPEISRQHCRLHWDGVTTCTIEDLGSRWGTKVNGAPLSSEVRAPLQTGDRIHIGPVYVYFGYGPPPVAAAAVSPIVLSMPAESGNSASRRPRGGGDEEAPPPLLGSLGPQVLLHGQEVNVIPLGGKLTLGRSAATWTWSSPTRASRASTPSSSARPWATR